MFCQDAGSHRHRLQLREVHHHANGTTITSTTAEGDHQARTDRLPWVLEGQRVIGRGHREGIIEVVVAAEVVLLEGVGEEIDLDTDHDRIQDRGAGPPAVVLRARRIAGLLRGHRPPDAAVAGVTVLHGEMDVAEAVAVAVAVVAEEQEEARAIARTAAEVHGIVVGAETVDKRVQH